MRAPLLLVALALVAGCTAAPPPPAPVGLAAELPGTTWTVERVVGAEGAADHAFAERVAFGADGTLSIVACNDCTGAYALSDSVLTIAPGLGCTRRACPAAALDLGLLLDGTSTLRRDGAYLVVAPDSADVELLLVPAR